MGEAAGFQVHCLVVFTFVNFVLIETNAGAIVLLVASLRSVSS